MAALKDYSRRYPTSDAGERKHRVTFLEQAIEMGASGAETKWLPGTPPKTTYAKIQPMRGVDIIKAGLDVSKVWMALTIRYRKALPSMRLRGSGENVYVIEAIENPLQMNVLLVLTCEAIGANAV